MRILKSVLSAHSIYITEFQTLRENMPEVYEFPIVFGLPRCALVSLTSLGLRDTIS